MADAFGLQTEEDPAAAFLAQQQHEIAGIENDEDNFGFEFTARDQQESQPSHPSPNSFQDEFGGATMNGELFQESNDIADGYAAISQADVQRQEPESLRKWREEQKERLEQLDTASKAAEAELRQKAKKELEDWHTHQQEQMEKNKVNNRIADKAFYKQPNSDVMGLVASEDAFLKECDDDSPGTEWEKVARLCDFNPKTSRQTKDVSRMRSVLISLKQTPLAR
ncbi:clathrin light chain B isoform X2 [Ictalurus furcatus]|uniref:clathrin light chain B isoform X2 n=1 Tax=Ictalurus furcatus TaxID=66913 RepID=UPI002350CE0A|nr:clathrin light chain B isoform X2 [Ictalurus furcatus]